MWEGSSYDPEPIELTDWAHCLYETPEGDIVLCAECASKRDDIEVVEQADDNAPCVACGKSFHDLRLACYDFDDPGISSEDVPF